MSVEPMKSEKVTVMRKRIYYVAFVRRTGSLAGQGFIHNIQLPKQRSGRAVPDSFGATSLKAWADNR